MSRFDRRRSLLLAFLAFVLVLIIWQVPDLSVILYPFRFFVTTIHELGHGMAALISGGHFLQYQVFESGAGVATTSGGSPWLVLPAGYVGTALFGAALLYLANRTKHTKGISVALGVLFLLLTALFARSLPAILAGVIIALVLIILGRRGNITVNTFTLNLLAIMTGLNAVLDLWALLRNPNLGVLGPNGGTPNDALAAAQTLGVLPEVGWALLWTLIALALLGLAAYYTFWRPIRDGKA
jgi:hypothetical protein